MLNLLALPEWFNPWGILAICALIIVIAVIIIIVCVVKDRGIYSAAEGEEDKDNSQASEDGQKDEKGEKDDKDAAPSDGVQGETEQPAEQVKEDKPAKKAEKAPAKEEAKKQTAKKTTTADKTVKATAKPAEKSESKAATAKPAEKSDKPADDKAAASTGATAAKVATKVYHISKRKDDLKWQVKAAGGSKAIKLFNTQADAIEFAKKLAENQEARIVIHKEDGSFRRLTYHTKKQ